jgi:hypothetical protein
MKLPDHFKSWKKVENTILITINMILITINMILITINMILITMNNRLGKDKKMEEHN